MFVFCLDAIVAGHINSAVIACFEAALQSWSRDCGWPTSRLTPIMVIDIIIEAS